MWQDVVFDVIEPGPHRIVAEVPTSEDEHASHVVIKRCSTDCGEATPLVVPIQSEGNGRYELEGIESGRHVIRIYRSESLPGPVSLIWSCHW
jgi:hypothetical protein